MSIAVILVHYHTPWLLKKSVEAIRRDIDSSSLGAEIIVVDNGSGPEDAELLNSLDVKLINPGENLGYAGGVNLGVINTDAEIFFLMNPDVLVEEGCLGNLVAEIKRGASAVGPRFFLDAGKTIMLPPLIELTRRNEILWRLSALGETVASGVRNIWREHARYHWQAAAPVNSYCLTGALIGIDRRAWEKIGPFDERYKLYFEEADWLRRLKNSGLKASYVPSAHAVHSYNQSASREPRASEWFNESMETYRKTHYGVLFSKFISTVVPFIGKVSKTAGSKYARSEQVSSSGLPVFEILPSTKIRNGPLWIEISDNDLRLPAAAVLITDKSRALWAMPEDAWASLTPKIYNFQLVDSTGNEINLLRYKKNEG